MLNHMLMQNTLRRGDGLYSIPDGRRNQRLLQAGRTKYLTIGLKIEKLNLEEEESYDPRSDTCVKAFVRFLAHAAANINND